jgi:2-oxoglutarate dehydrogenase complex dehydrogenase (E1) component-like enzyme
MMMFIRYALEGEESMIAAVDAIFKSAVDSGVTHVVIGMPHRGRLNFLAGLLQVRTNRAFFISDFNEITPSKLLGNNIKVKEKIYLVLVHSYHTSTI